MQVIGLIRFSLATIGGFQTQRESVEDLLAYLYSPARLEERFALFEQICLPGLRGQTDPDFQLAVVTGSEMPEPYMQRLKALLADVPQARLFVYPPMNQRKAVEDAVRTVKAERPEEPWVAHFRLDDDDAVAFDYVQTLRQHFAKLRGFARQHGKLALDHTLGYALKTTPDGVFVNLKHKNLWTPAQTIFLPHGDDRTIIHFPHHRLDKVMPLVSQPAPRMFVRSLNAFNDSGDHSFPKRFEPISEEHVQNIRDRFGIDVGALREAIKRLSKD